jgi:hypothetical protein
MSAYSEQLTADLLRPLLKTSWRFWTLAVLLLGVVALGIGAFAYQVWNGIGVWGLNWPRTSSSGSASATPVRSSRRSCVW